MALSETWLTPLVPSECLVLPNFNLVRNDRGLYSESGARFIQGGGVACYIHDSLKYRVLDLSCNSHINDPEFLILDIKTQSAASLLLAIVYRRPNGTLFSEFIRRLNVYSPAFKNIVIVGDLNCNLLDNTFESSFLQNFITDHSLYLVPTEPTHHTSNSQSQLDVIITDSKAKIVGCYQSQAPFIAGHDLLAITYNIQTIKTSPRLITFRNFANCDCASLANSVTSFLQEIDVGPTDLAPLGTMPIDTLISRFYTGITAALDLHAPITTKQVTRPMAPWLTSEIRTKLKERDMLYKNSKRSGNPNLMSQYRLHRKQLKSVIRNAKSEHLRLLLSEHLDSSKMWSVLRRFGLIETASHSSLQHFSPEELNTYYATITSVHPPCSNDQFKSILQIPPPLDIPKFSFSIITHDQVHRMLLSSLPKSRGFSPDGLQLLYLKEVLPIIVPPLTYIYNLSIASGIYPSLWKTSYIIPINKISNPSSPADTRPIANLSHLAKSFDALITRQITSFLETNKLLNFQQSGFRQFHSTQTALLRILDDIRQGIDQGLVTILVLFDFSKAFDTLNHTQLLLCLRSMGFDDLSLQWMFSYLSGRSQTIRNSDGDHIPTLPCTSGVPQGSSPGPILFIIFINSLFNRLRYCKNTCNIFADDTQMHLSTPLSLLNQTIAELNVDVNSLVTWARDSGLKLNAGKTKAIIVGSTQNISSIRKLHVPPIIVDGVPIPYSSTVKNLGIHIASDLSWNRQISQISTNIHHALYRLKFRGSSLPSPIKLLLVNSLLIPHFDYACLVFNDVPAYLDTKLQRLQNIALRFVYNLRRDASLTSFRQKAKWLTTRDRRMYFLGSLTYQILNTSSPSYLFDRFIEIDPLARRSHRHITSPYVLPLCRTDIYARSFWITAIQNWNSIPENVKLSPSFHSFKAALLKYLFTTT